MAEKATSALLKSVAKLGEQFLSPLDLLPHSEFREKCIDLALRNIPENIDQATYARFHELRHYLRETRVDNKRVLVFGGGTGLSNIIGGDSRLQSWSRQPFTGLKELFPKTRSIVCITDDGGSTGELMKDIPFIALGDIRHVLLSSVQIQLLQEKYGLNLTEVRKAVMDLALIINHRFAENEIDAGLLEIILETHSTNLPETLKNYFKGLIEHLFADKRLTQTLVRPHCLGNLLLTSAIYQEVDPSFGHIELENNKSVIDECLYQGIASFSKMIGVGDRGVMPCTPTPAQLRIRYSNGVEATGECKSGIASRGYPVEKVNVDFSDEVFVFEEVLADIAAADIIVMAPGSLYTSIIPIFQVPGIAEAVRKNRNAQKILVSNLWVQAGETDIAISDPERKFHVSDMIRAYEGNIPGGTADLFHEVLCLSLMDVPASVLQNYALEGKIPIYLDKTIVKDMGYMPLECGIYSRDALSERHVIQHDPEMLAIAVKAVFLGSLLENSLTGKTTEIQTRPGNGQEKALLRSRRTMYPSCKYRNLKDRLDQLKISVLADESAHESIETIRGSVLEIIWKHQDISLVHLDYVDGILFVEREKWQREQIWDNVYSFYDPDDSCIKICRDQLANARNLEIAVLIALGQSLLGDYAILKSMEEVSVDGSLVGKVFNLHIRDASKRKCYFSDEELRQYLKLSRMCQSAKDELLYTRLINGDEGFTPPGMLMGLLFAWYLDNSLASHIEYKMSLMKTDQSNLIPEQQKLLNRRNALISFFRQTVFKKMDTSVSTS